MSILEDDRRPQCFVAMWFGDDEETRNEMNQLFDVVIKPAVEGQGLKSYRVDRDPSADKIDERILTEIDRSDLVVVDLTHDPKTGLRGSVIFEAGYGYCIKPTIWMCRDNLADRIPFDIRQFKQIRWNAHKLLDAKKELERVVKIRIRERGLARRGHELKGLTAKLWKNLEESQDISPPDSGPVYSKNHVRIVHFEEYCDDVETKAKYKEMGLSSDEKYEVIEMIRGFKKFIRMFRELEKVPDMDFYRKNVEPKLRMSGWLDKGRSGHSR